MAKRPHRDSTRSKGKGAYSCMCGRNFDTLRGLEVHMHPKVCTSMMALRGMENVSDWRQQEQDTRAQEEHTTRAAAARAFRNTVHADSLRERIALDLARFRYVKMVPGTTVDTMKTMVNGWLQSALAELKRELTDVMSNAPEQVQQRVFAAVDTKFNLFDRLQSEKQEMMILRKMIPIIRPIPRRLGQSDQESVDAEGNLPLVPKKARARLAYDFRIPEVVIRLMEYSSTARTQIYNTLNEWAAMGDVKKMKPQRIITDIPHGTVFQKFLKNVKPEMSENIPVALVLYADAFTVRRRPSLILLITHIVI